MRKEEHTCPILHVLKAEGISFLWLAAYEVPMGHWLGGGSETLERSFPFELVPAESVS